MHRDCGGRDEQGGGGERKDEVHVDDEQRADHSAGEHRPNGAETSQRVTAGSAGEPGVGRDSGEGERENCGCEIRHREPAGHRILCTHRQRQWNDEPVPPPDEQACGVHPSL